MLVDTYGGTCPNCNYDRTLMRYGSDGYFQFDACANCCFAYGNNGEDEARDWEIWEGELMVLKDTLKEKGLPVSLLGVMLYLEGLPETKEPIDSVFNYEKMKI